MPDAKKILVVDDDPSLLELLVMILKEAGFAVRKAEGGLPALDLVKEEPPDLIVTDLGMPDLGGFEFLRTLQQGETMSIPVLILTAKRMAPAAVKELQQEPNVKGFMSKPMHHVKLLAEVNRVLQGR